MTALLLTLFLLCALVNFASSILILRELNAAGIKVGFYEIRWQVHKHLKTYKRLTRERTGAVGLPARFYLYSLIGLIATFLGLLLSLRST